MRTVFLIALILLPGLTQCRLPEEAAVATVVPSLTITPTLQIGVTLVTPAPPTAAVLQTTPSPLPPPTATATPTPIFYRVVEGDTLLGIAIQHNTTVAEIETLNPNVRPEQLQIGQSLRLPPPATAAAPAILDTAVPMQVSVHRTQAIRTPVGSLWLLGEVANDGELPVENVQVEIALLDESGQQVDAVTAWAALPIILPGGKAPFGVLVREPPAAFARPLVAVVGGATVTDLGSRYLELGVEETAVALGEERVQIDGQVHNSGAAVAAEIILVAAFYDSQDNLSGYFQQRLPGPLAPGEAVSFSFDVAPPGSETVGYWLAAQSLRSEDES